MNKHDLEGFNDVLNRAYESAEAKTTYRFSRSRSSWSWIKAIVICLASGFILSCLIAWLCAIWSPDPIYVSFVTDFFTEKGMKWRAKVPSHWPVGATAERTEEAIGLTLYKQRAILSDRERWISDCKLQVLNCGLPMRSMSFVQESERPYPFGEVETHLVGTIDSGSVAKWLVGNRKEPRALPMRIIWRGTICDTIDFAAAIFGLSFTGRFRRWMRLRRGLCGKCGYDLGYSKSRCPECGWTKCPTANDLRDIANRSVHNP